MCAICNSYPCRPACPNADEPETFGKCKYCKESIFKGEEIVDIDGEIYHYDCLCELPLRKVLELLEVEVEEAGD